MLVRQGTTTDCKGNSNQKGVGAALKASGIPRSELFVTTKVPGCGLQARSPFRTGKRTGNSRTRRNVWWQGVSRANCGPDSVAAAEDNLVELGLDYVDLLLVHFPPVGGCGVLNCNVIKQQWLALQVKWNHCRCATISMRFRRL